MLSAVWGFQSVKFYDVCHMMSSQLFLDSWSRQLHGHGVDTDGMACLSYI